MDLYLEQRHQEAASNDKVDIDGRLVAIVERMFERYSSRSDLQVVMPSSGLSLSHPPPSLACPAAVHLSHLHYAQKALLHAVGVSRMASLSRL